MPMKLDPEELEDLYDPDMRPGRGGKRIKKALKDQYGPAGGTLAANKKLAEANKFYMNKKKKRPTSKK